MAISVNLHVCMCCMYEQIWKFAAQEKLQSRSTAQCQILFVHANLMSPFWVYAEAVSRPYRWADDGWNHANKRNISEFCLYADQDSYGDVLPDMASGYMLFPNALRCLPEVCLSLLLSCYSACL